MTDDNWRAIVRQRVTSLDWQENILRDLQAFVIDPEVVERLNKDALLALL